MGAKTSDSEIGKPAAPRRITIEMWTAGVAAYERWDPEKDEPEAMVAAVFWAMSEVDGLG